MPSVFGEIGRKIEGWYRPICASFRKLLRESSQAARVRLPIRLADLLRDTGIAIQMGHKIRRESPLIHTGLQPRDHRTRDDKSRFNGFSAGLAKATPATQAIGRVKEASEPVERLTFPPLRYTWLKPV